VKDWVQALQSFTQWPAAQLPRIILQAKEPERIRLQPKSLPLVLKSTSSCGSWWWLDNSHDQ
jgi:hypothetical protein